MSNTINTSFKLANGELYLPSVERWIDLGPVRLEVKQGNLLDAQENYIVHQCNCTGKKGKGSSEQMFNRYPYADIYSGRQKPDTPGTCIVKSQAGKPTIVNLLGQRYMGKPFRNDDTYQMRLQWFYNALSGFIGSHVQQGQSIAIPLKIGAGLAAGNADDYLELIYTCATMLPQNSKIVLYELEM